MDTATSTSSQQNNDDQSQIERLTKKIDDLERKISENKQEEASFINSVENIAKVVGAVAGAVAALGFVFYIFGYQIVNNYYASYGLREFDINKPTYLSASIVFFLTIFLPIVTPLVIGDTAIRFLPKEISPIRAFILYIFFFLFSIYTFFYLENTLFDFLTGNYFLQRKLCLSIFQPCSLFVTAHFAFAALIFGFSSLRWVRYIEGHSLFRLFPVILIVMFIMMLDNWGKEIYPNIIPAFAGGQTTEIRLVLTKDAKEEQFRGIGIEVTDYVTEELSLLDQGQDYITVISRSCNAVKLSKSLITNTLFIRQNESSKPQLLDCSPAPQSIIPSP